MINRLCVIGVGLIGGSLALALKKAGYCRFVMGAGRGVDNLTEAVELGVIDAYETDLAKAVKDADVIIIAVPLGAMAEVFAKISPAIKKSAIITDVGSAKSTVIEMAQSKLGGKLHQFIPAHPIAGTEKSGAAAAIDSLYEQRRVILTPLAENSAADVSKITAMWKIAGAEVDSMSAHHHDLVLAGTSHLPHILAFALVDCLNKVDDVEEIFKYAAGGFRDFTRIASSDPVMWRDICLHNSTAILAMMQTYQGEIERLKKAIEQSDGEKLLKIFADAKCARDAFHM
jgi:prephenate dehydrogenase